jgi:aldehyde dehydrogenase (NAD+)
MSNETEALPDFPSLSPSNPSQELGRFKFMSDSEIQELAKSAAHAKPGWSGDPTARSNALRACSDLLKANRETLENLIVLEVGKPIAEAKGEIGRAISILDYYSVLALSSQGETLPAPGIGHLYSTRVPYGVAGLITPWNFPVAIPMWKAAPALAGGNTVIIKASEYATATATKLIEILSKALPANVLSLVTGAGSQGAKLISLSDVVSFTGSAATGQKVIEFATRNQTPVQAEMGGSNPAIVFDDADLDQVVSNLMIGAFSYSGQKCTATRKVITVGGKQLSEELARKLGNAMDALPIGDPLDSQTYIGPLINQDSVRDFTRRSLGHNLKARWFENLLKNYRSLDLS